MAIIQVSLHEGSGKRQESVWKGKCPICKKELLFSSNYFNTNIAFAIFLGMTNTIVTTGKSFLELLNSTDAVDIIGCEQCHHSMVICPFCIIAFSADANASIHRCPKCHNNLA